MSISVGDAVLKMGIDKTEFDNSMRTMSDNIQSSMDKMKTGLRVGGAAMTAFGVAGLKMIDTAKEMNAQLGVTALNLGITTKDMRGLALEVTNVTFPLKEVLGSFDLLARAGVKDTQILKATATAFDTLGDAVGMGASEVTARMVPAMKTFQLTASEVASKTDLMTNLVRNSTVSLDNFGSVIGYITPELVEMGLTLEDTVALMAIMEGKGMSGEVATRAFRTAITQATREQIPLQEALGITTAEMEAYRKSLDGIEGMTQKYADTANKQYGIMDRLKQKWEEFTLVAGSFLEPLEPIFALMTALGPVMIFLSTQVGISTVKWIAHTGAMVASKIAAIALNMSLLTLTATVAALTAGIGLLIFGLTQLNAYHQRYIQLVDTADRLNEQYARSQGQLTEEILGTARAYIEQRNAYGKLEPYEVAQVRLWKEIIDLYDSGTVSLEQLNSQYDMKIKRMAEVNKLTQESIDYMNKLEESSADYYASLRADLASLGVTPPRELTPQISLAGTRAAIESPFVGDISSYQGGGPILGDTLLTNLATGRPYAVAHEGEWVGASVMISGNNFYVRDESDIDRIGQALVDKIRARTGVK